MRFWRFWTGALAVILAAACVNTEKEFGDELQRVTPPQPPMFLNSDVANLFGSANFIARVEVHRGIPGTRPPTVGELSGRNGSLFFISDEQRATRGIAGGMSVLWDSPTKTAFLLNEPLQGYAPIRNASTNGPGEVVEAGEEEVNGERARKTIINQPAGSVSVPTLIIWRGLAHQDLPVRIQTTNSTQSVLINLSRIRFQTPQADLFALPNGFKAYPTTEAMMNELLIRRNEATDARQRARREKFGVNHEDIPPEQPRPTRQ